jgi:hypothetical protein|tara:strand:- start:1938 stop:2159 length:222 start_codon:yes stop_codon:yes gene_type:complete
MLRIKVEGYDSLVRDVSSNAIVNINTSEYSLYLARVKAREKQGDDYRHAVKEINSLKEELREIKSLLKGITKK